jgi:hypothetical protein
VYRAGEVRLANGRGRVILEDLLDECTEPRLVLDPVKPPEPLPRAEMSPKDENDCFLQRVIENSRRENTEKVDTRL